MDTRGTHGALNTAVASVLSRAREDAGLSTRQLAAASGIEHRTLMRYMYDERAIDMSRLDRLARALDLDPADVIARAALIADSARLDQQPHAPAPAPLGSGVRSSRPAH